MSGNELLASAGIVVLGMLIGLCLGIRYTRMR